MALPESIAGFAVFPVTYTADATHIIYGKAHSASKKNNDKILPIGRTLFIVNVPPFATEREIILFFKPAGIVERVVFDQKAAEDEAMNAISDSESDDEGDEQMQVDNDVVGESSKSKRKGKNVEEKPVVVPIPTVSLRTIRKTGRTAYVIFLDNSSLSKALTPPYKPRPWPRSSEPMGLEHYRALYRACRPPLDAVREHGESAIKLYDYEEAQKKQKSKYKKGEAIVDEDGFTLVTRGGAYGKTLGGGVGVASKHFQKTSETQRNRKKKEAKEKEDFYAFQKHEKKRQGKLRNVFIFLLITHYFIELIDLRKKWKEDVEKVEKLKRTRRFKPY